LQSEIWNIRGKVGKKTKPKNVCHHPFEIRKKYANRLKLHQSVPPVPKKTLILIFIFGHFYGRGSRYEVEKSRFFYVFLRLLLVEKFFRSFPETSQVVF
jgi:hypothetical protein